MWCGNGTESYCISLQWRHNERDGVSNHQCPDCLLNRLFRRKSKKISKFRVTGLCEGNLPVIGEFPAHRASNAKKVSIWWRHHVFVVVSPKVSSECWHSLTASSSYITSPNYPRAVPLNVNCTYEINVPRGERIELNWEYFYFGRHRKTGSIKVPSNL